MNKLLILSLILSLSFMSISCSHGDGMSKLIYKEEKVSFRRVLVNKFSGKIARFWNNGHWEDLTPQAKKRLQTAYNSNR